MSIKENTSHSTDDQYFRDGGQPARIGCALGDRDGPEPRAAGTAGDRGCHPDGQFPPAGSRCLEPDERAEPDHAFFRTKAI